MTETSGFGSKIVCMFVCAGLSLGTPMVQAAQEPAEPAEPTAPTATASDSSDTARASELYQNGKRLFREGSYEAAILSFKEGYRLSNRYQFLFNISQAYERMGEFGEAADYLDQYRAYASEEEAEVLSRKIEALRQREKEKQEREADLKAQAAEKAKQEQIEKQERQPQPQQSPTDQPAKEKVFGPASWALTATALAGFGLGIGMGIRANNKKNAALDNCVAGEMGTVCSADAADDIDARRTSALVSDIGFVVGGVATAATIVVTVLRAKRLKKNRAQALAPYAGPKSAGLVWTGHF